MKPETPPCSLKTLLCSLMIVCAACPLFADGESGAYNYLYMNAFSGTSWDGTFRSTPDVQDPAEELKWDDTAVLVFEKDTSYGSDVNCPRTCAGYWIQKTPPRLEGGLKVIGSFGVQSDLSGFSWWWYSNGPYNLTASQTWRGPAAAALSSKPFIVGPSRPFSVYSDKYTGAFTTEQDVTWTLAGDMVLMMYAISNDFSSCDIVIQKPAILSLPRHRHFGVEGTVPQMKARSITIDGGAGLYFGNYPNAQSGVYVDWTDTGIGCSPMIDPLHVASRINLTGDATLTALETTSVSGGVTIAAVDSATAAFAGAFSFNDDTEIYMEPGSTLDLTNADLGGAGQISFTGGGTLILNPAKVSAPYAFGEALSVRLSGEGRYFLSSEAFESLGADLVVASGTLVLKDVASIPAGRKIVTEEGAKLLLVDATGFDAATHLGGTQGYETASRLVVTDASVSGMVQVGTDETIEIWGDGLGEAATLEATCGATIRFMRSATVAAAVVTSNNVTFATDDGSVTGTVAGAWTSLSTEKAAKQKILIETPGLIRFTGGATLGVNTPFCLMGGSRAEIVEKAFVASSSLEVYGGYLTIRDGGAWRQNAQWTYLSLNMDQTEDATVEIGPGGTFERGNNCQTYIGKAANAYTSRLYINGGLFETARPDGMFLQGNGILEIDNGGFFSMETALTCAPDPKKGRIVLGDGTWGNHVVYSGMTRPMVLSGGGFPVEVKGDFLFDFASLKNGLGNVVTNTSEETSLAGAWTFRNGSCLRVRGRSGDIRTTFFVKNAIVEPGARFDLGATNPVANVEFANDGADMSLTWVCPPPDAVTGSIVGHGGTLTASYYVPAEMVFTNAMYGQTGWAQGFDAIAPADLAFAEGATWEFPFFGSGEPLVLGGALILPSALNYRVLPQGLRTTVVAAPLARTANGVVGGPCVYTCLDGLKTERATFSTVGTDLCLSYDGVGMRIIMR